jgi:hypothetical protein
MNYWRFKIQKDPIIAVVRKNREKLLAKFNFDLKKFSEYIIEAQKKKREKLLI